MVSEKSSSYFPHINHLRAFAALSVVIYHIIELFPWKDFPTQSLLVWFRIGWMGVDLFFVISGFVIMLSALKLQQSTDITSARHTFIRRRIARIVPLYLLTCLVFIVFINPEILLIPTKSFIKHIAAHLSFTHNLFSDTHGSINGPNWSVGAEFQFYIFVFFAMGVIKRLSPAMILAVGIGMAMISRAIIFMIAESRQWDFFYRFFYTTQVVSMMDEFCFGILIAKLVACEKNKILFPIEQFWKSKRFWVMAIITVIVFRITLYIFWSVPDYWNNPFMVTFWRSLLGASFAMLIILAVLIPSTFLSKNWLYKTGYYLGEISYGIYLWHIPILTALKKAGFQNPLTFSLATITCVLIFSTISWHFIEKPIIKRFKN